MYYSDGSKYVGDYHFGMMDGQGEYVWPNGVNTSESGAQTSDAAWANVFSDNEPAYWLDGNMISVFLIADAISC